LSSCRSALGTNYRTSDTSPGKARPR
jgi:hypothetical protein